MATTSSTEDALEHALGGLTEEDFASVRVTRSVPGRKGPHVAVLDIIKVATKTLRANAVQQWTRLKYEHPETVSGSNSFRFPGQRGPETEIVDLPTAVQVIMFF